MPFSYALALGLHVLAATLWVGGMAAFHFAVRPAAVAALEPPLRLAFMAAALARFFGAVTIAIIVLLASGAAMIALAGGMGAVKPHVHAMLALGLVMMALFAHVRFAPFPRLQRALAARDGPAAKAALETIRKLVGVNLVLGTIVILIATLGRAF